MPNHVHGVLEITERARHAVPLPAARDVEAFGRPVAASIPTVVRSYKSVVTKQVRDATNGHIAHVWLSNYFERVLRNADDLNNAIFYIKENPKRWQSRQP